MNAARTAGLGNALEPYAMLGKVVPPIEAQFLYSSGGKLSAMRLPEPGKVSLISAIKSDVGNRIGTGYGSVLTRYLSQFASRGFDVISMAKTYGYFADTAPVAPKHEANNDSVWSTTTLKIPGILAVYETRYTWAPDGRRRDEPVPVLRWYADGMYVIIADRRGIVRYVVSGGTDVPFEETLIARFIGRLLAE